MSRETDPDSDGYLCLMCGQARDEHAMSVNDAGIVTAGVYTDPNTFAFCSDRLQEQSHEGEITRLRNTLQMLEGALAKTTEQLAYEHKMLLKAVEIMDHMRTIREARIAELEAEVQQLRTAYIDYPPVALADVDDLPNRWDGETWAPAGPEMLEGYKGPFGLPGDPAQQKASRG